MAQPNWNSLNEEISSPEHHQHHFNNEDLDNQLELQKLESNEGVQSHFIQEGHDQNPSELPAETYNDELQNNDHERVNNESPQASWSNVQSKYSLSEQVVANRRIVDTSQATNTTVPIPFSQENVRTAVPNNPTKQNYDNGITRNQVMEGMYEDTNSENLFDWNVPDRDFFYFHPPCPKKKGPGRPKKTD